MNIREFEAKIDHLEQSLIAYEKQGLRQSRIIMIIGFIIGAFCIGCGIARLLLALGGWA